MAVRFRFQTRERAGRIDKGNNGPPEFFRLLHQAQGLAVSLGAGHPEIIVQVFLQIFSLAVADYRYGNPVVKCHAAQNALVVFIQAVTPQLKKILKQRRGVVAHTGALRPAGQIDLVGRGKLGVGLKQLSAFSLQLPDAQLGNLGLFPQGGKLLIQLIELELRLFDHAGIPPF